MSSVSQVRSRPFAKDPLPHPGSEPLGIKFPLLPAQPEKVKIPDVVDINRATIPYIQSLFERVFEVWELYQHEERVPVIPCTTINGSLEWIDPESFASIYLTDLTIEEVFDKINSDIKSFIHSEMGNVFLSSNDPLGQLLHDRERSFCSGYDHVKRGVNTATQMIFGFLYVTAINVRDSSLELSANDLKAKILLAAENSIPLLVKLASTSLENFVSIKACFTALHGQVTSPSFIDPKCFIIKESEHGPYLEFSKKFLLSLKNQMPLQSKPYTGCPATKVQIERQALIPKMMRWAIQIFNDFVPAEFVAKSK